MVTWAADKERDEPLLNGPTQRLWQAGMRKV